MIAALLQHDPTTRRAWLTFPSMPPTEVRTDLKAGGWLYHGGHRSWHHAATSPPMPAGVTVAMGDDFAFASIAPRQGAEILAVLSAAKASLSASMRRQEAR